MSVDPLLLQATDEVLRLQSRVAELEREREEAKQYIALANATVARQNRDLDLLRREYDALDRLKHGPPIETCGHDDSSWCDESCDAINAPAAAGAGSRDA